MSFRKNSILFYENVILLAALSLLMIAVGLVKNFPILCLCAVPLLIVALVSPKLDREYITIDEWGHFLQRGGPAALELRLGAYRRIAEKLPVSPPLH